MDFETIRKNNKQWFAASRFFDSLVYPETLTTEDNVSYFVSSERGTELNAPRLWSIRRYDHDSQDISTVGEFQGWRSKASAVKEIYRIIND